MDGTQHGVPNVEVLYIYFEKVKYLCLIGAQRYSKYLCIKTDLCTLTTCVQFARITDWVVSVVWVASAQTANCHLDTPQLCIV